MSTSDVAYTETRGPGSLGRLERHDKRSYGYVANVAAAGSTLVSKKHTRYIPVLDQDVPKELGSCTGNATTGCLGTGAFWQTVQTVIPTNATQAEAFAVKVYSLGTTLDDIDGSYPPTDTGCSGIGVAKAAQQLGLISGYTHTFTYTTALQALMLQPVIIGIPWLTGMDSPDSNGIVSVSGTVRGGHEIVMDEIDVQRQLVGCTNSWSASWGLAGRFYIPWTGFASLLKQGGDVTVFTANTAPAPVADPDTALWGELKDWAKANHTLTNKTAAQNVLAWAKVKGLAA